MNRMKITFGIMSNKYQIEAYNKLDAYAAMVIFFKRDLPYVLLFEPYEIIKDNCSVMKKNSLSYLAK